MDRQLTEKELKQFFKLIDEGDIETLKALRDEAQRRYDFSGFDHCNLYNRLNYLNGTLHALERTRQKLSIESAQRLIDILFILGYAYKRIMYIIYEFGYLNVHYRDVMNYIHQHKRRLLELRKKFMDELNQAAEDIFQTMKNEVMQSERETLLIYLEKIKKVQEALKTTDPVEETTKFKRLTWTLTALTESVKSMHGVEALRTAKVDIAKEASKAKIARAISLGLWDEALKEAQPQLGTREIEATTTLIE